MTIRHTHPRPWLRYATEQTAGQGGTSDKDTAGQGEADTPGGSDTDELAKWKALARKHEAQAKANAEAARRLADIDEESKTDTEKVAERIQAAEDRAAAAEAKALRLEIATAKGLTPAQAKRLTGATVEELEADADELLESFGVGKARDTRPKPTGRPVTGGADDTMSDADLAALADTLAT